MIRRIPVRLNGLYNHLDKCTKLVYVFRLHSTNEITYFNLLYCSYLFHIPKIFNNNYPYAILSSGTKFVKMVQ